MTVANQFCLALFVLAKVVVSALRELVEPAQGCFMVSGCIRGHLYDVLLELLFGRTGFGCKEPVHPSPTALTCRFLTRFT